MRFEQLQREASTRWQIDRPTFRVDFWTQIAAPPPGPHGAPGYSRESYLVSDAELDEVEEWAAQQADGRDTVVYVSATLAGESGLIRLRGTDPTSTHR